MQLAVGAAGVVDDERVEPAEALDCRGDEFVRRAGVREVDLGVPKALLVAA